MTRAIRTNSRAFLACCIALTACTSTTEADDAWVEYVAPDGFIAPVRLDDGRLFSTDRAMRRLFSEDNGQSWHHQGRIGDSHDDWPFKGSVGPMNFCRLQSGDIALTGWLIDHTLDKNVHGMRTYKCYFIKSDDEGNMWSAPVFIPPADTPAYTTFVMQMDSGRLVIPCEYAFKQAQHKFGDAHQKLSVCTSFYSDDEGETWLESADSAFVRTEDGAMIHFVEAPAIAQTADGRLLMLMRTEMQRLAQTYSDDGGVHWDLTELSPLVSSRSEVVLVPLPTTGDLLCVWSQVSSHEIAAGYYRSRLSSAISSDSGKTWQYFRTIQQAPGMEQVGRIAPESPPSHLRSGGALPIDADAALADGFESLRAPRVSVIDDKVYVVFRQIIYQRSSPDSNAWQKLSHATRLRVIPLAWFYNR